MSAAANGTLYAVGRSGRQYVVDFYQPDAAATLQTYNPSGASVAASLNYWRTPEEVFIRDVSIATGTACVGCAYNSSGALINGAIIRYANHLNTLANRPVLNIRVGAGELLGAVSI
jgi:hypothetical protein